jgi:type II secretory pathway component GspD/PulD (secretin)
MLALTKKTSLFLLILFCNVLFSSLATGQNKTEWLNNKLTIRFQEEPMSSVLGQISAQTGIAILYDEKLAVKKVTGYYKDIEFSEAINRLFSETNKSIQVFKNEKKVIVKTFGAKQFVLAGKKSSMDSTSRVNESKKMTLAELEKIHKQQYKEYQKRIADDNEVLEGVMTRAELKAMHKRQNDAYLKRISENNAILEGGMTRDELETMHKRQNDAYLKRASENNAILEGGMSKKELQDLHEQQGNVYKKRVSDQERFIH